ncbi:hypothetical protein [Cognatishimia activa]|uniref:Uncharacterized protein n=1 Tax=Cognatishimia activa TaxID=1715691 RepID=A0A975ENN2_9RHOB|nr:hypothetical protein [Cognatishimia activa]QTN35047.1 hypothetical protein HZ995_11185 [Cognatishimia activa]
MKRSDIVLVDACIIIEAHRVGVWNAMHKNLTLETVETCIIEAQTGRANRLDPAVLDAELRAGFSAVHQVSQAEIANHLAAAEGNLPVIDAGELELWVHACQRDDVWFLCGPDRASMRFGYELGYVDRLVSMEQVLDLAGVQNSGINAHYQEKWLSELKTNLTMGIL